jgi:uncharacterized Zn-finger protein
MACVRCNITIEQTRDFIEAEKFMRTFVSFMDRDGAQCHLASLASNRICQGDSINSAKYLTHLSATGPDNVFFFFQSVKLNGPSAKAVQFIKDITTEEIHGEQIAELSEIYSEKNFDSCKICKNPFSRSNDLPGHTSASSRKTMSRCEMCVTSFTHQRRGRERNFSCDVCKKRFTSRSKVDIHFRVHSGERPFSCEFCKKMFAHGSNLNKHRKLYSGQRPFSCKICKKMFAQRSNLITHLRLHSGETLFSCKVCKKRFTHRSNLKKHLRVHSG